LAGQKAALLRVPGYCAGEHAGEQLSRKRRYGSGPGQRVGARCVDRIVVGRKRQWGPTGRAGPGHGKGQSNGEKGHSIVEGGVGRVGTVVRNGRGGDVGTGGVGTVVRNGRGGGVGTGGVGKLVRNGLVGGVGTGGVGTLGRNGRVGGVGVGGVGTLVRNGRVGDGGV